MENVPYIPKEIVDMIANYAEGSAGLSFMQSSKYYDKVLHSKRIQYYIQYQKEIINKRYSITINQKTYYCVLNKIYCQDCSCKLKDKSTIISHQMICSNNKSMICEYCDSPRIFHRTCKKIKNQCAFAIFSCPHCQDISH